MRLAPSYTSFASLLAEIFKDKFDWKAFLPDFNQLQDFILSTADGWVVFNLQRLKQVDDTELMQLECFEVFLEETDLTLFQICPEKCSEFSANVTEKLLHDNTSRMIRNKCLDIV